MEVGQVSFHDQKRVLKIKIDRKSNEIINRLEKTRQELNPDFKVRAAYHSTDMWNGAGDWDYYAILCCH